PAGELDRVVECALCEAERECGDADPATVEGLHEVDEALALSTEPVLFGHDRVLEDELPRIGRAPPHLVFLLARPDAGRERLQLRCVPHPYPIRLLAVGRLLGHDEAADAPRALPAVRDRRHHEHLTHTRVSDENLTAIQAIRPILPNRGGPGAAGVGACAGFGQSEPSEDLATGEERDEPLLLLLGPETQDRRCTEGAVRAH